MFILLQWAYLLDNGFHLQIQLLSFFIYLLDFFLNHIIIIMMRKRQRSREKQMIKAFTFSNRQEVQEKKQRSYSQKLGALIPQNLQASNQLTQYFSFKLQDQIDQTDTTLAWQYNVPTLSQNQKQVLLVIQQFQISLLNYASQQFPQNICIGMENFSGFKDSQGNATNKIIVLQLIQVQTTQMTGYVQRDLIFKSQTQTVWSLGSLRNLKFRIYLDDSPLPLQLPLTNPLNVCFKLLHVTY